MKNFFSIFFCIFEILNVFKKKMPFIVDVFWKLKTPKMFKKSSFWRRRKKQHGKLDQTLLKSELHHFYHIYWSLWRQLSSKYSLLVIRKISGLFFNPLIAGQKYSPLNSDNLTPPTQMQLSLKWKTLPQFFCAFLK